MTDERRSTSERHVIHEDEVPKLPPAGLRDPQPFALTEERDHDMSGEDNRDPDRLEIPVYSDADVQRAIALKLRMQHELDRRHKKRNSAWTRLKRKLLGLPGH